MDCCHVDFACCLPKKTSKHYFECDDPLPPLLTPPSFLNWRFWILVAKCLDKWLEQILRTFLSLLYSKHNFFSWYAPPSTWQSKTTFFKETQALKLWNFQHPTSIILNFYSFSLFIKKSKEDKMKIESLFLIVRILNWH